MVRLKSALHVGLPGSCGRLEARSRPVYTAVAAAGLSVVGFHNTVSTAERLARCASMPAVNTSVVYLPPLQACLEKEVKDMREEVL